MVSRLRSRVANPAYNGKPMKHSAIPLIHSVLPLSLGLVFLLPAGHAATPEAPKSIFWEPYQHDDQTVVLYHFDEEDTAEVEAGLEDPEIAEDAGPGIDLLPGGTEGGGPAASDAIMLVSKTELLGACKPVAGRGRFGGGLLFEGKDGRIAGGLPGEACTIEFWMQPEKPARSAFTILHLSAPPRPEALVLRLRPDGALELEWAGQVQRVPGYQFRAGEWTHIALAWETGKRFELRLGGTLALLKKPLDPKRIPKLTRGVVGNDDAGKNGFRGLLDEVRVSSSVRAYYPHTFGWARTVRSVEAKEGRPFFREARDLRFRLDFNRTVRPAIAPSGTAAPEEVGETLAQLPFINPARPRPPFMHGIEGQAAVVGKDGASLEYRSSLLLSPDRGTISFWARPLNWNNYVIRDRFAPFPMKTIPVFEVVAGDEERVAHFTLHQTPNAQAWQHPVDIHPGRWMHLCMAWEDERRTFFLDGRPWPHGGAWSWEVRGPDQERELTLRFGRDESQCAVDDFRIYNRALAPSEAANLAALFDPRRELRPLDPLEMIFSYNGVLGRVEVELYPLTADHAEVVNALVTLTPEGAGKTVGQQELKREGRDKVRGRLSTPPFGFGTYELRAVARDAGGNTICEAVRTFERKQPPWWGNKLGVTDKVMPGWTPVEVKGRTLSVVCRDIRFSDSGLPESLVSAGEEILAAPIALTATAGGKAETLKPVAGAFRAETKGKVRADFAGKATGAGIAATVKGYLEFDGMMWFSVTLRPTAVDSSRQQSTAIESLRLTIPYTQDASRLLHWWSGNRGFRNPRVVHLGATPEGQGDVFASFDQSRVALYGRMRGSFIPYVMLTGDQCGMAWFAENDRGWTQSREIPAVVIRREGQTVALVLNVISETTKLGAPRAFEFGLHPTPVKPIDPDWRITPYMGMWPDSFWGFNLKGPWGVTDNWRHPKDMDWKLANRRYRGEFGGVWNAADLEQQHIRHFRATYGRAPRGREEMPAGFYADLTYINAFPAHTREWGEVFPAWRYTPEIDGYWAWVWNLWLDQTKVRAIYFDDCFNDPRDGALSVAYRRPDGARQPGFQWRQLREHLRRTRQVFLDRGLRPNLCAHSTHTLFIPYHSFFDTILDGEDFYKGAGNKRDFMDSWPPDRLRFMHPEKWGMAVTWLNWFAGPGEGWEKFPELRWRQWRAYTAALLVHDQVWTVQYHQLDRAWIQQTKLRLEPTIAFIGYWDSRPVASHQHEGLYVSAWKREGWCAVALANWSRQRIEAEVTLDLKAMGFEAAAAEALIIRDVDTNLLSYFDGDLAKPPDAEKVGEAALLDPTGTGEPGDLEAGAENEEDDLDELGFKKKFTLKDRKAADPDGKFEWKDGLLKCPVRPHDFRLFEFRLPLGAPAPSRPQR